MSWRSTRRTLATTGAIVMIAVATLIAVPDAAAEDASYDSHRVLVAFEPGTSAAQRASAHAAEGTRIENRMEWLNLDVVRVPERHDPPQVAQRYERNPNVRFAEPNWVIELEAIPDDPLFSYEWGLHNTGQEVFRSEAGTPDADIDAPEGWDAAFGETFPTSGGTRVGVLDTGIDLTHPELSFKVFACARATSGAGIIVEGDCADDHSHGTHVAGTIAAATNNGIGVAGVAPDAGLAVFKFLNSSGSGQLADAVAGLHWLHTVGGARIVNMSFGCGSIVCGASMDLELREAYQSGTLLVAAAGNDACFGCYSYPAAHPDVISVAATDSDDRAAWFSNCNDDVELAAPGVDVWSTVPGGNYSMFSGTSMATPHVAGVAALIMSEEGTDVDSTRAALISSVDDLGPSGRDWCYGHGRVNLATALGHSPTAGALALEANGYKFRGLQKADLTWSGATSPNVDIYRGGSLLITTSNDGFHTDNIDQRGKGNYTYKVCDGGTNTCSNEATVTF